MATLENIMTRHGSLLVLDAASQVVQVGWLERDQPGRWAAVADEAGRGLFRALAELGVAPRNAGALGFCEGPGSILGIRTAAVALTTWNATRPRPLFAFRSLELLAATIAAPGATVIADARRQTWHALKVNLDGSPGPIERRATADLPRAGLTMPDNFRTWTPLPEGPITPLPYDLATLWQHPRAAAADLWRPTEHPDAFQHEAPDYVTWTPGIHRAPTPASP